MPANLLTKEDRELRNRYVAILSGFAPNILGQDLMPLLSDINAKAILIPRQAFKYYQRPWAFVYFESEAQLENAKERTGLVSLTDSYTGQIVPPLTKFAF